MPHIHTKSGEHDVTVSMTIIRTDMDEPRILLHMHRKLNVLMIFGGHIELIDNPWQTVAHELAEESGYRLSQLKILQPEHRLTNLTGAIVHPLPFAVITVNALSDGSHKHDGLNFAFTTAESPISAPIKGESQELRWLTLDELIKIQPGEIFENVRELCIYVMSEVLYHWVPIDPMKYEI